MFRVAAIVAIGVLARPLAAGTIESFTEPFRRIEIAPAEPGIIATIDVREGEAVKAGQQLAALECEVLRITLQIARLARDAQGRQQAALAEHELRRVRLAKLQELRPRGHASGEEVERARADLAVADANLLAIKEQQTVDALECAKTEAMIERRTMRSPIDGVVTRVLRDEREFVTASNPTVLTVVQLNPLRATFSVPTQQALSLKPGQTVKVLFSETEKSTPGSIELISPVTEAESGTVRVKVLLENGQNQHRCGVRCELQLDSAKSLSPLVAP
jgi:RND family efflux transporter MFP subunit